MPGKQEIDERIMGIAGNRAILKENLEILNRWVENEPYLHYVRPKSGTTALLYYDMALSSTQLCHDLMATETMAR